jgi:acyl transferase domain-containing protein
MRTACKDGGVEPGEIDYVEAHGTGTPVGDPIEADAIGTVYYKEAPGAHEVLLGACKSVIGHTEAAAGIASLIKAVMCLRHRMVPANLHCSPLNPAIDFAGLGLHPADADTALPADKEKLLAGINAFGFGGTNAHVIIESYGPAVTDDSASFPEHNWNLEPFWHECDTSSRSRLRPYTEGSILGTRVDPTSNTWEAELSADYSPALLEHEFLGEPRYPTAACTSAALSLAKELYPGKACAVTGMEFTGTLSITPLTVFQVQTQFDASTMAMRIYGARDVELKDRVLMARASLSLAGGAASLPMANYDKLSAQYPVKMDAGALYDAFAAAGYKANGLFKATREARVNGNEAVTILDVPADCAGLDYHPAVLDGIVQAALAALSGKGSLGIPQGFESLRVLKPLTGTLFCHALLAEDGKTATIEAYNDKGEGVCIFKGVKFEVKAVKSAAPAASVAPAEGVAAPAENDEALLSTLYTISADALEKDAEPIGMDANLADLGIDSLGTYLISTDIQDKLGVELDPKALNEQSVFADLVACVRNARK